MRDFKSFSALFAGLGVRRIELRGFRSFLACFAGFGVRQSFRSFLGCFVGLGVKQIDCGVSGVFRLASLDLESSG